MPLHNMENQVVAIVGPTAVGKTDLSIFLAGKLGGEIISTDSRLFYRGMDIGTAKPTAAEQSRVPHHLIDIAEPDQPLSLSVFQRAAFDVIDDVASRGRVPILVGGTGQYVWSVLHGWEIPQMEPDPRLRQRLEKWAGEIGAEALHNRLRLLDPTAADRIQYQNIRRTVRALEVTLGTGRRFSDQSRNKGRRYEAKIVGISLPREDLYQKIDLRIDEMFRRDFISEVENLLEKGYSGSLSTMSAIGYREVVWFLNGRMTLDEVKIQMKRKTREFVRRQANWFKRVDDEICWFDYGPGFEKAVLAFLYGEDDAARPGG